MAALMCPRREAIRAYGQASSRLAEACLARLPDPIGEAIERAYDIDPIVPEEQAELLARLDAVTAVSGRAPAA